MLRIESNAFKVTLLFSLFDNGGNPFEKEVWDWWLTGITKLVSGFTELGLVTGWWFGHSDRSRWIIIILKSEAEVDKIKNFLRLARGIFRQKKMYLDYHPVYFEEVE